MPEAARAWRTASRTGCSTGVVITRFGVEDGVTPPMGGGCETGNDKLELESPDGLSPGRRRVNSRRRGTCTRRGRSSVLSTVPRLTVRESARPSFPITRVAAPSLLELELELEECSVDTSVVLVLPRRPPTPIAPPIRWTTARVAPATPPLPHDHDDDPLLPLDSVTASSLETSGSAGSGVGSAVAPRYRSPSSVVHPCRLGPASSGWPASIPSPAGASDGSATRGRRRRRSCAGVRSSANSGCSRAGPAAAVCARMGVGGAPVECDVPGAVVDPNVGAGV